VPPSGSGTRWGLRLVFAAALVLHVLALYSPGTPGDSASTGVDKMGHTAMFAILIAPLLCLGAPLGSTLLAATGYAVVSEFIQAFAVPHRSGDFGDLLANLLGIALGWLIWRALPEDRT
jgi:VanZ family protein